MARPIKETPMSFDEFRQTYTVHKMGENETVAAFDLPLTYPRDAATCPTFEGRTAETVGGMGFEGKTTPPRRV